VNSFLNLSTNAIKTADSLIKHAKEETYDEVEDSIKSLRKNFKAGNYFCYCYFFYYFWYFKRSYTGFQWKLLYSSYGIFLNVFSMHIGI